MSKVTGGLVLIVLGLIILVWGAFGFKTRETVVDVGPIHASKETPHDVPYGPVIGGVLLIGGIALVITARK